jgi:hypothetical protein
MECFDISYIYLKNHQERHGKLLKIGAFFLSGAFYLAATVALPDCMAKHDRI